LRDALQHIMAQFETDDNDRPLRAALITTERIGEANADAQAAGNFDLLQCRAVVSSVRDVEQALRRDRLSANSATTDGDRSAANGGSGATKCGTCSGSQSSVVESLARQAIATQRLKNEQELRRKCERYAMLALAMILLVVTVLAIVLAVRSGRASAAHKAAERKLDALMVSAMQRRNTSMS